MKKNKFTSEDVKKIFCNPFYAINLSAGLFGEHEPLVSKDEWIKVNMIAIQEDGAENYLKRLLDVLEGKYI